MSTYKTRRDAEIERFLEVNPHWDEPSLMEHISDWARADLMKQVDEILVKALDKHKAVLIENQCEGSGLNSVLIDDNQGVIAILKAWKAIKGEEK